MKKCYSHKKVLTLKKCDENKERDWKQLSGALFLSRVSTIPGFKHAWSILGACVYHQSFVSIINILTLHNKEDIGQIS